MPKITFDKVTKNFGQLQVLPPLDLILEQSEFTVLVGPSGCGKSTTLRILAGLEQLSGGEIYFDEKPISRLEPKDRDIAMVFQDYALYPHMNVARNMSFSLRLAGKPKNEIEARVTKVAGILGIGHLLDRKPAALSGGQRQRVAMGRALVRDAPILLFDEPLSNLDAKLRGVMRTELAMMRKTLNKNMVYVTHDQVEAMTLGDRIVVMHEGRIQQQGTAQELFLTPANIFVAGFIGSPPINFLDGEIIEQAGKVAVKGDGFSFALADKSAKRIAFQKNRHVKIGIRPSDLAVTQQKGDLEAAVMTTEYLGSQTLLSTRLKNGTQLLCELPSAPTIPDNGIVQLVAKPEAVLFFDPSTENRI